MLRVALVVWVLMVAASHLRAADGTGPAATISAASASAPVVQPDKVPGNWKLTPQPLPPLEDILKRPAAAAPVYGLYTWMGEYKQYRDSFKKVGWKSYRVGGPLTDDDMKMIVEDGVEVMKCVGLGDGSNRSKKAYKDFDSDEAFVAAHVKACDEFLTRYGPGGTFFKDHPTLAQRPIRYVEILNEPNFQYMIPDGDPKDRGKVEVQREALYAKLLPPVHTALKEKWPTVQIVGFGAGGASAGDLRFIEHVLGLDAKAARSMDILSTHPYVDPAPPEVDKVEPWGSYSMAKSLAIIRQTLTKHDVGNLPIWYTELGWPISKADGGFYETKDQPAMATPLLQAAYVVRTYALAMRLGVERVHVMHAADTDHFNAGFFLRDGTWRPAAQAVQTIVKIMPNPMLKKALSDGVEGYWAYEFKSEGRVQRLPEDSVTMVWNVAGPKTVEIAVPAAKAQVTDMLGQAKTVVAQGGKITVEVGPCPVYVRALGLE